MIQEMVWSRAIQRAFHLLFAIVLGVYIYSPLSTVGVMEFFVQAIVFPGLVLSGVLLWKAGKLHRWYHNQTVKQER